MRPRFAFSLLVAVLAFGLAVPALPGQSLGDVARKTREKNKDSDSKVYTNEDFPSGNKPPAEAATPAGQPADQRSPEELFNELDTARADLERWNATLAAYRKQIAAQYEMRGNAETDYDRDSLDRSIDASEEVIRQTEQAVADLQARVAELEKLTQGMTRPAPKPGEKEAETKSGVVPPPPELVMPQAGPQSGGQGQEGEQPPPPPSEGEQPPAA